MVCPPRIGETLQIHKSRFPTYYDDILTDDLVLEGMVHANVLAVDHLLAHDGRHLVRIDFEFED